MNLGSRLEEVLKDRGMTVMQLAREAEVPAQTLYAMIRRDSNKVDMNIMARILVALEMDLPEFVELKVAETRKRADSSTRGVAKVQEREAKPEPEGQPRRELETYLL